MTTTIEPIWVKMRDGVRLSTHIYLPDGSGPFPTVLGRTPYGKGSYSPQSPPRLVSHGYAVVVQDCRGKFASEGEWFPVVNESLDGYDTIEWIARQPWSNGRIGMTGGSYGGIVQWAAAAANPPHLCCIIPQSTPCNHYENWLYRGGAAQIVTHLPWAFFVAGRATQEIILEEMPKLYRTLPLAMADAAFGRDIGFWREWMANPRYNKFWEAQDFSILLDRINVPALCLGSWFDMYAQPALEAFAGQRHLGPGVVGQNAQAIIGPWAHNKHGTRCGDLDFGTVSDLDLEAATLSFLGRWLKDEGRGQASELPLKVFVMGRLAWREENNWPLESTRWLKMYLHSGGRANTSGGDGTLLVEPPRQESADTYQYDPLDPVPTLGGNHSGDFAGTPVGPIDQRGIEERPDVLVYTTAPLTEAVEVVGPLSLHLAVATTALDTDFTGKLVDVYPDGRAIILSDGIMRLSHWCSLQKLSPIVPGQIYEIKINLGVTANCFLPGHSIRLEISSSNFPRYSRNLNTGLDSHLTDKTMVAGQTIFHEGAKASWLELPVVDCD